MRSLLMVGSLCAAVMMFSGCATVGNSGGCGLKSCGGSGIGNCQTRQAARQARRQTRGQADCGCNECEMSQPMESYEMPAGDCGCSDCAAAMAPAPTPASSDCGCSECASSSAGPGGLIGRMRENSTMRRGDRMAMRLSEKGTECANEAPAAVAAAGPSCSSGTCGSGKCGIGKCSSGTCGLRGKVRPCGGQVLGGRVAQAGGHFAGGGCGFMGCGARGQLCSSCGLKARLAGGHFAGGHHAGGRYGGVHTKPYPGAIPHTAAPPTFNGGPGGGGVPQYVYPYYTTRGPRDFLMSNPPSIGP